MNHRFVSVCTSQLRARGHRRVFPLLAALTSFFLPVVHGQVAVDAGVPAVMDAGGTVGAPAAYIVGSTSSVTVDYGTTSLYVGQNTSYNQLTIQNGATLIGRGPSIGTGFSSGHNAVIVDGPGSTLRRATDDNDPSNIMPLHVGGSHTSNNSLTVRNGGHVETPGLWVGEYGSDNHAVFESGASFQSAGPYIGAGAVYVGYSGSASGNTLTVRGAGTTFAATGSNTAVQVGSGANATSNSLRVEAGATFTAGTFMLGQLGTQNTTVITGAGSVLSAASLTVGYWNSSSENSFTVADFGLARVDSDQFGGGDAFLLNAHEATGNVLRLDGGFLAWKGDHTADVSGLLGDIQVWNGIAYESAGSSSFFSLEYFDTDFAAKAFTSSDLFAGYDGLGGYTIFANSASAVPEPSTWAAIVGAAALGAAALRRRQRSA